MDMFELPEAKRVRRSELFRHDSATSDRPSRSNSPTAPDTSAESYNSSYHFDYDFQTTPASNRHQEGDDCHPEDGAKHEKDTFEFRLFSSKSQTLINSKTGATLITVRSPTPPASISDGRFINPYRPQGYYFTQAGSVTGLNRLKSEYAAVAIDGNEVLGRAKGVKWPGTALPWRVTHLNVRPNPSSKPSNSTSTPTTPSASLINSNPSPSDRSHLKHKPSKKRRIHLRRLLSTITTATATEAAKRTARNREKKVKRKAREKAKKAEVASAAVASFAGDGEP